MQKEIKQKWHFDRSPKEVWEYLTKPELIEQWLMGNNFQPTQGYEFQFNCDAITYCKVLEIIPNQLLSYSWKTKNADGNTAIDSVVTWILLEKNGGTELQLVHNGFTVPEDYTGHNNAWTATVGQLAGLLSTQKTNSTNALQDAE